MTIKEKGILFSLMEKYDNEKSFSNSISNVIQGKETDQDLINIVENMDYGNIEFNDYGLLEEILGDKILVSLFSL